MRIATFNLLSGRSLTTGHSDESDLRESARLLDADIVGLQEVDRLQPRSSLVDQTKVVAEELQAPYWRFVPALQGSPGSGIAWTQSSDDDGASTMEATFGVGLVSRWPVLEWQVRRLAAAPVSMPVMMPGRKSLLRIPDQPRVALAATIDGPSGRFTVITTHLSIVPSWNVAQLRTVIKWAAGFPSPQLLIGDLNLPGPIVRATTRWNQLAKLPTFPSPRPRVQLDHVLGNGIDRSAVTSSRAFRMPISDHRPLIVTVDV